MSAKFEEMPVESIELDLKNPRIAKWVEIYGDNPTAEQIALALGAGSTENTGDGTSFSSLKQSILTNGGIIHPIIVNKKINGKAVVIEGNTRTLIYREFNDKNIEGNWKNIPAMVYENLDDETIDSIRLQAHLVGVRQWDPYSKAKYLDMLRNKEHLPFSRIVDFCGGNKREIENYIQAYNDMENFYRNVLESDQDFDPSRFSAFVELQRPRITEAIIKNGYNKSNFSKWVAEGKLSPLNTVRKIPSILKNKKAEEAFIKYDATEAIKLLESYTTETSLKDADLNQLLKELSKRINNMKYQDILRLRNENNSEVKDSIYDTRDAVIDLCKDISDEG